MTTIDEVKKAAMEFYDSVILFGAAYDEDMPRLWDETNEDFRELEETFKQWRADDE